VQPVLLSAAVLVLAATIAGAWKLLQPPGTSQVTIDPAAAVGPANPPARGSQGAGSTADREEADIELTIEQVPAAVRTTLEAEAKGAKIAEIDKNSTSGVTIYETDVAIDRVTIELQVSEDGKLVSRKETK
jgi:hypothetical protein